MVMGEVEAYLIQLRMQSLKSDEHLCKSLKRMLKKEGRINFELRELNELVKSQP
jgi:hypothetical protein